MRIKLYGQFRDMVGDTTVMLPEARGGTVGEVLLHLVERYSGLRARLFQRSGELQPYLLVAVSGLDIRLSGGLVTPGRLPPLLPGENAKEFTFADSNPLGRRNTL